nr:MAG: hypothetical protein [Bacteriophage sp.]
MTSIKPIENNGRVCKAERINEIKESVMELSDELVKSNDALDDLDFALDVVQERHYSYMVKSKKVCNKMRKLSSEL